jgi:hypothetical protein
MHDWRETIRGHIQRRGLPRALPDEVVSELAAHLEESYEDARTRGLNQAEAFEHALQGVGDWNVLTKNIFRATQEKEQTMFIGAMNYRTKSLWLPGLANFTAASLFLLVLTQISLQPQFLVRLNSGLGRSLYIGWLFAQLFFGALGAFLSRRAGGTRTVRVAAATFPAIVMFGLCALVIPVSAVFEHNVFVLHHPARLALGILIWVVVPAIGLLLGAAPFLKDAKLHAA